MSLNAKPIATELTPNPASKSAGVKLGEMMVMAKANPTIVNPQRAKLPKIEP